jgi:hypothetical protein
MKPLDSEVAWRRLTAAAQRAPIDPSCEMPLGFSTRVAALAFSRSERPLSFLFERFSLRALGVAGLLAALTAVANVSPILKAIEEDLVVSSSDPVSELIEL